MNYIIGLDEVGMGSWSGMLCIAAIRAPIDWSIPGLRDSKKLSAERRQELSNQILELVKQNTIQLNLQTFNNDQIDELGLGVCHKTAMAQAINALYTGQENVVIDGNIRIEHFTRCGMTADPSHVKSVIKADNLYPSVMAASIVAKCYRDNIMSECAKSFPVYGWEQNAGYIVPAHLDSVRKHGLSCLHRRSYKVKL